MTKGKKNETKTSEAAQAVDYSKYTARLGTIEGVLKQAPNAKLQQVVDDINGVIEAKRDEKLCIQLIGALKTYIQLEGEAGAIYAAAMPQRVRSSDPKAQEHYTQLDNELNTLMNDNAPLLEVMFSLKIGMRVKEGEEPTLDDYRSTLRKKNRAVNKYNKTTSTTAQPAEDSSEA